jgi:CheY-like chemotaxis protein
VVAAYQKETVAGRVRPAAGDAPPARDYPERLGGLKVRAVDDGVDTGELFKAGIGQCGAEVVTAGSAREALAAPREMRPDLLISDIGMQGEDGYELIRKVRALPAARGGKIPAIALTAYARTEDRVRAPRAGYRMHIVKPVELAELVAVTASLAGRSDKADETVNGVPLCPQKISTNSRR